MLVATGIIVGLLILGVGGVLASLIGMLLLSLGGHLARPAKKKAIRAIAAGASGVVGILFLTAGPLASLWAAITVAVNIIGG